MKVKDKVAAELKNRKYIQCRFKCGNFYTYNPVKEGTYKQWTCKPCLEQEKARFKTTGDRKSIPVSSFVSRYGEVTTHYFQNEIRFYRVPN
jgi:hypothetical protein